MRCYVPPDGWDTDRVELSEDEAHHISHVLRGETGRAVIAFDGHGREADAVVEKIHRGDVTLKIEHVRHVPRPSPEFVLIQGLPREQKMDFVLQKSVELGVSTIHPVVSDHSVARPHHDEKDNKLERWQRIVLNAAKQCGAAWLPVITPVETLIDRLQGMTIPDLLLVGSLEPDAEPLKDVLRAASVKPRRSIGVIIGAEGDLSARERAAVRQAGARPVSLGNLTLRTETAALYTMSILQYEFR